MKKIIISIIMAILVFIIIGIIYLNIESNNKVAILTYHNIEDNLTDENYNISTEYFEKQMKWLYDNGFKTITMDEFYEWKKGILKLPRKSILITFDDGWESVYTKAYPILKKYNFKATSFVIWSYITDNTGTYISENQINEIKKKYPNIEFESHTYRLHELENAKCDNYDIYNEDIKKVLNLSNTKYIAYPNGYTNDNYKRALQDNNYKLAFSFGPYEFAKKNQDDFAISRLGYSEKSSFLKFKLKLLFLID